MKDQAQKLRELIGSSKPLKVEMPSKVKTSDSRVITISSGKGGVGKTNFTVNLALALANNGNKVTIIDADLGLANIDVVLGLVPKFNLFHMLRNNMTLDEITVEGPNGIKIISGGSGVMDLVNLSDDEISKLIESLHLLNEDADYILIDTGAGLNKSVMSFIEAAGEVVMIVTPDPTSITDAYAVIKNIADVEKNIKVVINRVESNKEGYEVFHKINSATKKFLNIELESLGFIYEDVNVRKSVKQQRPFYLNNPNSLASKAIDMIAFNLDNDSCYVNNVNGFSGFIKRLLGNI